MVFKLCPNCHTKNSADAEFCDQCDAGLANVNITSDEVVEQELLTVNSADNVPDDTDIVETSNPSDTDSESQNFVRICDECNHMNPSNARKCQNPDCGADISGVPKTLSETCKTVASGKPMLKSEDGSYSFVIPEGVTVIGRDNAMSDYLETKTFVSREHGYLTNSNGNVYYEDHSSNGTVLNGNQVTRKIRLTDGDKLWLGYKLNVKNNDRSQIGFFVFKA